MISSGQSTTQPRGNFGKLQRSEKDAAEAPSTVAIKSSKRIGVLGALFLLGFILLSHDFSLLIISNSMIESGKLTISMPTKVNDIGSGTPTTSSNRPIASHASSGMSSFVETPYTPTSVHSVQHQRSAIVALTSKAKYDQFNLCRALQSLENLPDTAATASLKSNSTTTSIADATRKKNLTLAEVIVFHEGNLNASSLDRLAACGAPRNVSFAVVNFTEYPDGFDAESEPANDFHRRSKWGYQQMIRFFITRIWKHPAILHQYDTVMRLDTDACWVQHYSKGRLPGRIEPYLDPKYVYQRHKVIQDKIRVCDQVYNFTINYMAANNITPSRRQEWQWFEETWLKDQRCLAYYNNLEIVRVNFMLQPQVQMWHHAVTETEPFGVFRYRWGDAIIRYLTMALFAKSSEVLYRKDSKQFYKHTCPKTKYRWEKSITAAAVVAR